MIISSTQNPGIKLLKRLYDKASVRREEGLVPVEGLREISLAIQAGFTIDTLFHCPAIKTQSVNSAWQTWNLKPDQAMEVSKQVFESIAYREIFRWCGSTAPPA